jgi:hypothetical protein
MERVLIVQIQAYPIPERMRAVRPSRKKGTADIQKEAPRRRRETL